MNPSVPSHDAVLYPATATPSLKRRFGSMMYEAMLLFGILFIAGLLFSTLLQQRNALYLRHGQQIWLFVVLTAYFVWCWSHGGQTLAMKTWRLQLLNKDGSPIKAKNALVRYLLAWLWFLPGLMLAWAFGAHTWMLAIIPVLNFVLWSLTIYLDPQRQFLHDRLAGTKLVDMVESAKPSGKRRWYH